jgi:DNA mismatch repair protein MutS2
MEFDSENLVPTYRFRQGFPGSSFAFEIAKRIGLEEKIIQMANQLLDKDRSKVEHFIADLEGKIRIYAQKISEAEEENRRLIELTQKYKNLAETLRKEKAKILEEAKNKGEEFLKRANKEIEKAIKQIKENGAEKNVIAEAKKTLIELQNEFEEIKDEANQSEDALQEYKPKIGDYVCLKGSKAIGQVKEINEEKKIAYVTLGGLKVMCKYSDLSPTSKEDFQKITTSQKKFEIEISAPKSFALDLRGLRYSEAETEIIKFIDQSFASGLDKIEIIHGKGNGVLKKLTWDILKKDYRVKNFYFAPIEIGGDGVTIAEFI